jgi:rhodanese-related sulfurtransferase
MNIRLRSRPAETPLVPHRRHRQDADGMTLEHCLEIARGSLPRLVPREAELAMRGGAVLVDIRSESQRRRDGVVPGSIFIPRNVLEWRCTPSSAARDPRVSDPDLRVILMCDEGYQSSLAAAALQQLGMPHATDLAGGFQAWRGAGLAVEPDSADAESSCAGGGGAEHGPQDQFGPVAQG